MSDICVFGDSITWGAVDPEGGGWATRLRNHFESQNLRVDHSVNVYNLGVSGDNTDDLKKRFQIEMEARDPGIVMFAIGINDSQFVISRNDNRVSLPTFKSNLAGMIASARTLGKRVVIVGLTRVDESKTVPIPWNTDKEYRNADIEKYDTVLKELAEEFDVSYVDVSKTVANADMPDGLHPDSGGHKKLCEEILKAL